MILIIGGANQGKKRFARGLLSISDQREYENGLMRGEYDTPESVFGRPYISGYHEVIRALLKKGKDPETFTRDLIATKPEIVIMDEVGCGIVPISRDERDYREAVGRAGQLLAARAVCVYRVMCGIGMRIK